MNEQNINLSDLEEDALAHLRTETANWLRDYKDSFLFDKLTPGEIKEDDHVYFRFNSYDLCVEGKFHFDYHSFAVTLKEIGIYEMDNPALFPLLNEMNTWQGTSGKLTIFNDQLYYNYFYIFTDFNEKVIIEILKNETLNGIGLIRVFQLCTRIGVTFRDKHSF